MQSILFVDDEPRILSALRRMLHPLRDEWDMSFVESAQDALTLLKQKKIDILITDLQMPEMDGVALLEQVHVSFPQIVRILISSHAEQLKALNSVKHAHQFLNKPCTIETLRTTITKAMALQNYVSNPQLAAAITNMESLPSLPHLYQEIEREMSSSDPSIKTIGAIIEQDVGMTAKVLQLVNSAFFGISQQVTQPAQAVNLLGIEIIKSLVCTIQVFSQFEDEVLREVPVSSIWNHSLQVGAFAREFATVMQMEKEVIDCSYLAGNLHDIGQLILAMNYPEHYGRILDELKKGGHSLVNLENEYLPANHTQVGAYVLSLWGFSPAIVETVAFHGNPSASCSSTLGTLASVYFADYFLTEKESTAHEGKVPLDWDYVKGLAGKDLGAWLEICRGIAERDFFA